MDASAGLGWAVGPLAASTLRGCPLGARVRVTTCEGCSAFLPSPRCCVRLKLTSSFSAESAWYSDVVGISLEQTCAH